MKEDSQPTQSSDGYNRLAPYYQTLERLLFPSGLDRARQALLHQLPKCRSALVLGDGDGRLLAQLCQCQPQCQFLSIDSSSAMLELQRKRVKQLDSMHRVEFRCQDALTYAPESNSFDLTVMAFFLDCFSAETLDEALPQWLVGLREGGLLYFVDFVYPTSRFGSVISVPYFKAMHLFFRSQTNLPNRRLVDLDKVLLKQSLSQLAKENSGSGMVSTRVYEHFSRSRATSERAEGEH